MKLLAVAAALLLSSVPAHALDIKCGDPEKGRAVIEGQSAEIALMEGEFQMEQLQGEAELFWNPVTETFTLVWLPPANHPNAGQLCIIAWGKMGPADPRPAYQPKPEEREAEKPDA